MCAAKQRENAERRAAHGFYPAEAYPATWIRRRRWEDETEADIGPDVTQAEVRHVLAKALTLHGAERWLVEGAEVEWRGETVTVSTLWADRLEAHRPALDTALGELVPGAALELRLLT
jgi:hypothetical protein